MFKVINGSYPLIINRSFKPHDESRYISWHQNTFKMTWAITVYNSTEHFLSWGLKFQKLFLQKLKKLGFSSVLKKRSSNGKLKIVHLGFVNHIYSVYIAF